ncbi:MAG: phosphatidylglycerol lysyltransferase domain-containing protein [Eubacterium sp.]|nr:phosphatidylglycerol lysyltransferase domain-containing protein [Eubacterium sp.]
MIDFNSLSLRDREWVTHRLLEDDRQACEYSFANNFLWSDIYGVKMAKEQGCLIFQFQEQEKNQNQEYRYTIPIGAGNRKGALDALLAMEQARGSQLVLSTLMQKDLDWLERNYPGKYTVETNRDDYDYVYSTEKLSTLSGRKLHGKRNHIARFKDDNNWMYRDMMPEDAAECMRLLDIWKEAESENWNDEMENELHINRIALRNLADLVLDGGMLYKGGRLVAFSIGEPLNSDTYVVHIEKALASVQGAYPMINQQFVLHHCQDFAYVNREEDTGDEGLRKAKLSYQPVLLVEKYEARFQL